MPYPVHNRQDFTQLVKRFMTVGGCTVMGFNASQATLYTGLQCEELAEKLEEVAKGCIVRYDREFLLRNVNYLMALANELKKGMFTGDVMRADRKELLDANIDLAFVSIGAAFSTSVDTEGAMDHVGLRNLAKFPDGVCTKDANGKIMKPAGWTPPDLSPFVIEEPID